MCNKQQNVRVKKYELTIMKMYNGKKTEDNVKVI